MWLITFGISVVLGWFLKVILDVITHKRNNNIN